MLSCVWLFVTLWNVAHQAPWSIEFPRQEYWSGLPFHTPGDLPHPRIEPMSPESPSLQVDSLMLSHWGNFKPEFPHVVIKSLQTRKKILEINWMKTAINLLHSIWNILSIVSHDFAPFWFFQNYSPIAARRQFSMDFSFCHISYK